MPAFTFNHNNINVFDLEKSVAFYKEALGLTEVRRHTAQDSSFTLVFLGDGVTTHRIELTWLRDRKEPYNLGDNEMHIAFSVDDYAATVCMKRWAASVMRILRWDCISLKIPMVIGWR